MQKNAKKHKAGFHNQPDGAEPLSFVLPRGMTTAN